MTKDKNRLAPLKHSLRLIKFLRTGRRFTREISAYLGCCDKTVKRYITAMQDAGIPIEVRYDGNFCNLYWIDRKWTL